MLIPFHNIFLKQIRETEVFPHCWVIAGCVQNLTMATQSSNYVSRGILQIFCWRAKEKPPELLRKDNTNGKLLRLHLRPTAQMYIDVIIENHGTNKFLELLDIFFDTRGKIPAARMKVIHSNAESRIPTAGLAPPNSSRLRFFL